MSTQPNRLLSATPGQSTGILLVVTAAILVRIWFWQTTDTTLEDAYITFRYVDNIAVGHGFVYNQGEHVLGTSTPLWTVLLASLKTAGIRDFIPAAKALGIMFDCLSIVMMFLLLREISTFAAFLGAALFATSPAVVPITVSGMESSLLLLAMSVALIGSKKQNSLFALGLALTLLTRIDGILFALTLFGAALFRQRRWALRQGAFALALCLPWIIFSFVYFGSVLPQSFLAKREVYHLPLSASLEPFLRQFTPWGETRPMVFALKGAGLLFLILGGVRILRNDRRLVDIGVFLLLYTFLFALSGAMIFAWYLVPAAFASFFIAASGAEWCLGPLQRMMVALRAAAYVLIPLGLCSMNVATVVARADRAGEIQGVEVHLRKEIGVWIHDHVPPESQVFLEPIGYVGYFAGPAVIIRDEVGLVTPAVVPFRRKGDGWYADALRGLSPDYLVQYAYSLDNNVSEGTGHRLFRSEEDEEWFRARYREEHVFDVSESYPLIDPKEKKYVLLKRVIVPEISPVAAQGAPDGKTD